MTRSRRHREATARLWGRDIPLGSVTDSYVYKEYGEVSRYTAGSGPPSCSTQRIETVDGITRAFEYAYDEAGRLANVKRNGEIIAAWTYDANGNRLTGTETGHAQVRL